MDITNENEAFVEMENASFANNIQAAAELIADAYTLVITADAGIGIDSGLPDFRGENGFLNAYPALGKLGMNFTSIANPRLASLRSSLRKTGNTSACMVGPYRTPGSNRNWRRHCNSKYA